MAQIDKKLLYEYENVILGNQNTMSPTLFKGTAQQNERDALSVIKYAVEVYLKWTPDELEKRLDAEVVKRMHFDDLLKYVTFPTELNKNYDFYYVAYLLYPDKITFNYRQSVVNLYRRILANQLSEIQDNDSAEIRKFKRTLLNDPGYVAIKQKGLAEYKFPKEYMKGEFGRIRAGICFQHMIQEFYSFHSIAEIYEYFSDTKRGIADLKRYRLYSVYKDLYESPLEYVHGALPEAQKNPLLYNYFKFVQIYDPACLDHKEEHDRICAEERRLRKEKKKKKAEKEKQEQERKMKENA